VKTDVSIIMKMVDLAVGVPKYTYPMYENSKRPEGDYAAAKFISEGNPGVDSITYKDSSNGVIQFSEGIRIITYDIMFSRDDEKVILLDSSFTRPDIKEYMYTEGLFILQKAKINNKNITRETSWEVRTGLRLQFNILRKTEINVGQIDTAIINNKITNDNYTITT